MKNFCLVVTVVFIVVGGSIFVNAQGVEDKGSETVIFEKGRMPQVTFRHHFHQQKLNNDCNACHDLFSMQAGIIQEMIGQEKLKKQQVMNSKCVKCHKDRKTSGLSAGPTTCTACHVRPE